MKDEFSNENMLKILIDQKKYLEAFRLYKELLKSGSIKDASIYTNFLEEVRKIDPVLTMDKKTREKKIIKLSNILNKIRLYSRKISKRETSQVVISQDIAKYDTTIKEHLKSEADLASQISKGKAIEYEGDIYKIIEKFTLQSISSVMNIICGNFSKEILSKRAKSDKIVILNEMLKRIEVIKNQRKKELQNV